MPATKWRFILLLSPMHEGLFILLLFIIALLYSSVGHGGASSYLALMVLYAVSVNEARSMALVLNLMVSGVAFVQYARQQHINWSLTWPFLLGSVPMAFWGAGFSVDPDIYKKVLGVLLLFSVIRLVISFNRSAKTSAPGIIVSLASGAAIGFLSGLIGIGGGIILSPLLLLLGWGAMKETAATSAIFIFVNSLSGLMGMYYKNTFAPNSEWIWLLTALAGGVAGGYWGSKLAPVKQISYVLGLVLLMASVKLIFY